MDSCAVRRPTSRINLAGGERRRVALCKLLLSKPDLLLDEPTNHLDAESVQVARTASGQLPRCDTAVTTTVTSGQRRGMDPGGSMAAPTL